MEGLPGVLGEAKGRHERVIGDFDALEDGTLGRLRHQRPGEAGSRERRRRSISCLARGRRESPPIGWEASRTATPSR